MNGIKVAGEFLDMFPSTRVTLVLPNPIFAEDNIIPGDYTLPLTIPIGEASPKNSRILNNPQVIENTVHVREVDAFYFYDGLKYKSGKLVLGDVDHTGKKLSVNFKFGLSTLPNIKSSSIRDIVSEEVVLNDNTTYVKEVRLEPELVFPFHITINGRQYVADSIDDLVDLINADTTEPRVQATSFTSYFTVKPISNPLDIATPFTIDCDDPREWTVITNDHLWNDPILESLNAYLSEPYPNNKFRLPTLINPGQFEEGYQYFKSELVNASKDGSMIVNVAAPNGDGIVELDPFKSFVFTSVAPYVMLKHVLDKIADHYGFVYEGDFYSQPWIAKALLYTPNSITQKIPFIGEYDYFFFRQTFNINEFVPDLSVNDFFKALQRKFNLAVYYKADSKRLVLRFRKTIIRDRSYIEISSKSSPLLKHKEIGVKGVRLKIEDDKDDKLCPADDFFIGSEEELTITSPCFGLNQRTDGYHTFDDLPAVNQPFSDKPYKFVRIFFYEGLQESAGYTPFDYPKSRVDQDDFSLRYAGDVGMYETQWKEWIRFLMLRRSAGISTDFSFAHMLRIDWEKKLMFDRSKYLYDKIEISLGMNPNERSRGEVSLFKTA